MIRSKNRDDVLWPLVVLALHVWPGAVAPAQAQGSRKDDIVFNSRGIPACRRHDSHLRDAC